MPIHVLPPSVSSRIAAGEVVERPASVVKELLENCLDAGARHITIDLLEGGQRLIRVADDGCGIGGDQVELAFQRYATSKLETISDLEHIRTLGFRGEALASIAAVSHMTMITRSIDEAMGTRIQLEGGRIVRREVIGAPVGTVITVENLFYNMPARLKFLKKDVTERGHINGLVSRYAVAYPGIGFSLAQGGQEIFRSTGSGDRRAAMLAVYGLEVASQMLEIESGASFLREDLPPISVSGFVGAPALNRSNRNHITLFVNGRWVVDSALTHAVIQAYHTLLMTGRFPVAMLLIDLPPEEVDVNIHPTKAEVRFRHPDAVFSAVQRITRRTLIDQAPPPHLHPESIWGSPDLALRRERLAQVTSDRISQIGLEIGLDEPGQYSRQKPAPSSEGREPRQRREIPLLRVVGQVGGTYIVAEGPQGLYLIDQHAAHERVLYEQLSGVQQEGSTIAQELLEPVAVELPPDLMAVATGSLDALSAAGFIVEIFGRSTVQIRAVPALVAQSDPGQMLLAALGEIECGEIPGEATAEQRLIARVCKQAAVKAGQILSFSEMEVLIRQLEACRSPRTCPHGRPTMIHLSAEALAREFGRLGAV